MKHLIIEELKRCVELLEKEDIESRTLPTQMPSGYEYHITNRDTVELMELFKLLRKHTIKMERMIYGKK